MPPCKESQFLSSEYVRFGLGSHVALVQPGNTPFSGYLGCFKQLVVDSVLRLIQTCLISLFLKSMFSFLSHNLGLLQEGVVVEVLWDLNWCFFLEFVSSFAYREEAPSVKFATFL